MSTNGEFTAAIIASIASSGGLWTTLQLLLNRRQRQAQARRETLQDQKQEKHYQEEIDRREVDRRELLAKAQATAQRAALESADKRYDRLESDYQSCRDGLLNLRDAAALLINAFEGFLVNMRADEGAESYTVTLPLSDLGEARRAINEVRRNLR